jgi:tetratricopeptide (TPR) repeat protein
MILLNRLNAKGANMYSTNFRLALWCVATFAMVASCAADSWQDARIMPKSDIMMLQAGGPAPPPPTGRTFVPTRNPYTAAYDIEWPATVEVVEGQWLWIEDHGGYSVPPVAGWVKTEDVLKLDDPTKVHDFCTYCDEQLKTRDEPWLHWLRGIYLEKKSQARGACKEYDEALKGTESLFAPKSIADMLLPKMKGPMNVMSGRLAARSHRDGSGGAAAKSDTWDQESKDGARKKVAPLFKGKALDGLVQAAATGPFVLPCQFDAKIRLERLLAKESKSSLDAECSAIQILIAMRSGERRPYAYVEAAESLKKAYQNMSEEDQATITKDGDLLDRLKEHKRDLLDHVERKDEAEIAKDLKKILHDIVEQKVVGQDLTVVLELLPAAGAGEADGEGIRDGLPRLFAGDLLERVFAHYAVEADLKEAGASPYEIRTIEDERERLRETIDDLEKRIDGPRRHTPAPRNRVQGPTAPERPRVAKKPVEENVRRIELVLDEIWAIRVLGRAGAEARLKEFWCSGRPPKRRRNRAEDRVADEENLLVWSNFLYHLAASKSDGPAAGGNARWSKGDLGRAVLHYARVSDLHDDAQMLYDEANDLVDEASDLAPDAGQQRSEKKPPRARGKDAVSHPRGRSRLSDAPAKSQSLALASERAGRELRQRGPSDGNRFVRNLAVGLRSRGGAIIGIAGDPLDLVLEYSDEAVRRSPDLAEAHRCRAAAYCCRVLFDTKLSTRERDILELKKQKESLEDTVKLAKSTTDARVQLVKGFIDAAAKKAASRGGSGAAMKHVVIQLQKFESWKDPAVAAKHLEEVASRLEIEQKALAQELARNENLQQARIAAIDAYNINQADVESLKTVAGVFAALRDYDRAERYQRLAVTYASDEDRRDLLVVLEEYRRNVLSRRLSPH